jgi:hypothetical protein
MRRYFRDAWSTFDFVVVAMSVIDIIGIINQPFVKLLRVLRVLRLVRRVKALAMMLSTLVMAVPSIISALLFLGIWIFIFAAVGSDPQMFPFLKHGKVIDSTWNFENIFNAVLLLFRTATGDGWFDLIYDASIAPPLCTPVVLEGWMIANGEIMEHDHKGDCGEDPMGRLFFIIYYLGCNFLFMPLFVATLIDYFFEAEVDSISLFNEQDCELYKEVWSEFDGESDGYISIDNLRPLIDRLGARDHPCGFNTASDMDRFKRIWARVMSNPTIFQTDIVIEEEAVREDLGLSRISRENMIKAYGEGSRAKKIREYIYKVHDAKPGDKSSKLVKGDEVCRHVVLAFLCALKGLSRRQF